MANTRQNRSTSDSRTKQPENQGQRPQQSSQKMSGFNQLSQQWDKSR